MTTDQIWAWALRLGAFLLFTGGLWALAKLIQFLDAKAATSKVFQAVHTVAVVADGILSDVSVGLKPDIDAAAADGVVTTAERQAIAAKAFDLVKRSFGTRGLANVGNLLGIASDAVGQWVSGVVNNRLSVQLGTTAATVTASPSALAAAVNAAKTTQAGAVPR